MDSEQNLISISLLYVFSLLPTGEGGESSTSSDEWEDDDTNLQNFARKMHRAKLDDGKSTITTKSSDLFGPVNHTAALHRPVSYTEIKQEKMEKLQKAGATGTVERYCISNHCYSLIDDMNYLFNIYN